MGTKHDDDDLMLDTPYGRKRWGTIRKVLDAHDDLLEACKAAAEAFKNHLDYDHDDTNAESVAYAAIIAAIARAEAPQ